MESSVSTKGMIKGMQTTETLTFLRELTEAKQLAISDSSKQAHHHI
jgi:hypothetical protein